MSVIENLVGHKSHQRQRPYASMFMWACWHQQLWTKCTSIFYLSPVPLGCKQCYSASGFYKSRGTVKRARVANGWGGNGGTICVTLFFINADGDVGWIMYRGHSAGHVGTAGRSRFTLQLLYVKDEQDGGFFSFFFLYPRKRYHYAKGPQRLYGNSTDGINHVVLNTTACVTIKKGHQLWLKQ